MVLHHREGARRRGEDDPRVPLEVRKEILLREEDITCRRIEEPLGQPAYPAARLGRNYHLDPKFLKYPDSGESLPFPVVEVAVAAVKEYRLFSRVALETVKLPGSKAVIPSGMDMPRSLLKPVSFSPRNLAARDPASGADALRKAPGSL